MDPDFEKVGGLIPAITQDASTGEILMMAYMNEESLQKTIETGEIHYWSRSRQELWHKGGTSGNIQKLKEMRIDCDGDTLLVKVEQIGGAACHTGHRSCFHYRWSGKAFQKEGEPIFDPQEVYGK
ncbi:MAG: phosphoribosyl-AMP cyclohydrolase [Deltaproteobacteria bacterium]|nr:phosphoribosyl-AMP cyclohydrolase [Deltaproteobacteria bacterium]MBW2051098.1 phosphoribosyl-AMP cyclohydrolase [Deltaproteobacteria bacterium]MBW2140297.1 phosphoribosyl-AMP cyclohydrolase [Deltaproteobacteria bacterium]MBW2322912.1 phosphoribosyl-AMP cyclohydrolase [Deltaproteobacteria bacterium]